MSKIKVSESKFWEVWPQVKSGFPVPEEDSKMRDDHGDCPITAVARFLGDPVNNPDYVYEVLYAGKNGGIPDWASDMIGVADGDVEGYEDIAKKLSA